MCIIGVNFTFLESSRTPEIVIKSISITKRRNLWFKGINEHSRASNHENEQEYSLIPEN